jgi:hypothetical protein
MERNTAELVRDSKEGLIPYTTWAIGFFIVLFGLGFAVLGHILGLLWLLPLLGVSVAWVAATAHGFRHGWLK